MPGECQNQDVASAVSSFSAATFQCDHGARDYKLFLPSNGGPSSPLLVMLHGCTQSPDDIATGTRLNDHAESHGLAVLYPGQPISANPKACWNWFSKAHQARDQGEPGLLAELTRQIVSDHQFDQRQNCRAVHRQICRVFVAGMSAGGAMSAILALQYPELYRAVGVHSGLAPGAATNMVGALLAMKALAKARKGPLMKQPAIVFHGENDSVVHFHNARRLLDRLDLEGTTREDSRSHAQGQHACSLTLYRDKSGHVRAESWLVHGLDHAWSGGSSQGSYTDARGPDASMALVRFFLSLPDQPTAISHSTLSSG